MRGEATYRENLPLVMNRRGFTEQTWFTFSYSPVRDEQGTVAGMFCAVAETTEQVLGQARQAFRLSLEQQLQQLSEPHAVMGAAAEALGRELGVARVGYGEVDDNEATVLIERDWTDGETQSLVGTYRLSDFGEEVVAQLRSGKTVQINDALTDPRTAGTGIAEEYIRTGKKASIIVPIMKGGRWRAALYAHSSVPRHWQRHEVELAEDVAERTLTAVIRVRAEASLKVSEERYRQLSEAVKYCWPASCCDCSTSHSRNSVLSRPSGCRVMRPVTSAWALMVRQSPKRGTVSMFEMRSM